jgi:hypothetical protein
VTSTCVNRSDLIQTTKADDEFFGARDPTTDQSRVATLRHNTDAVASANSNDYRHLSDIAGPNDSESLAAIATGEVALKWSAQIRFCKHVARANGPGEFFDYLPAIQARERARHRMTIGFTSPPTPPRIGSGAPEKKHS